VKRRERLYHRGRNEVHRGRGEVETGPKGAWEAGEFPSRDKLRGIFTQQKTEEEEDYRV